MQAAFLMGPQLFELREIPAPLCPEDGLVMDVAACGVCGSDLRRWREGPPANSGGVIPGHEASGIVSQTGASCSRFSVGDRIAIAPDIHCGTCYFCRQERYNLCDDLKLVGITPGYPGGFADKLALDGHTLENGIVHKMPEGLSFRHAAVSEPACSVLATQNKADIQAGDTVVVVGAGPTGCLHIAMAKARGASVLVAQRSQTRQELAARFHPDRIIDVTKQNLVAEVLAFTGGLGADVVICANPVADTQRQAVEYVRKGGKVMLFGGLPKADPVTHLDGNKIHYGEVEVIGAFSYHPKIHREILGMLAQGQLPADTLITGEFPLDQIDQAYASAATGQALKVLITFGKGD
jgi:L-iditol 2-dehydrogenase